MSVRQYDSLRAAALIASFPPIPPLNKPHPPHPMVQLMQRIAAKNGIEFLLCHEDRIIRLKKNDTIKLIQGYVLPINSSSSARVCKDKAATSDILKHASIPQVRHRLFLNPQLADWLPSRGVWPSIHAYGEKHHYNVICKAKDGGGGREVYHAKNGRELERFVEKLFGERRDVVLCAFKAIKYEYRLLVLNQRVELILRKMLPEVVADGRTPLSTLISSYLEQMHPEQKEKLLPLIPNTLLLSQEIPAAGTKVPLHWKHNAPGAPSELLGGESYHEVCRSTNTDASDPLLKGLIDLALRTTQAIGIRFAAVDIVELHEDPKGKTLRVLEVNSAMMLDHEVEKHRDLSAQAEVKIYTKIVRHLFNLPGTS